MSELLKITDKLCDTCKYSKMFDYNTKKTYCDYLCMTGHRRNCKAWECDKYEKREGKRKNARPL